MSEALYDLLTDIAFRCEINSKKTLRKTRELITLLNSKKLQNCSDTCKVVVCLDLASSLLSSPLSREKAIKYSGCKQRIYTNFYNNISKLLNLDKIYSVTEICLLVGAYDAKGPANKLLQKYIKDSNDIDFEHPMYACAAVLAFCRTKKVKINLSKLFEFSRVKKLELEKLTRKFSTLLEKKKIIEDKEIYKSSNYPLIKGEGKEETPREMESSTNIMTDKEYEEWKRRMLED